MDKNLEFSAGGRGCPTCPQSPSPADRPGYGRCNISLQSTHMYVIRTSHNQCVSIELQRIFSMTFSLSVDNIASHEFGLHLTCLSSSFASNVIHKFLTLLPKLSKSFTFDALKDWLLLFPGCWIVICDKMLESGVKLGHL